MTKKAITRRQPKQPTKEGHEQDWNQTFRTTSGVPRKMSMLAAIKIVNRTPPSRTARKSQAGTSISVATVDSSRNRRRRLRRPHIVAANYKLVPPVLVLLQNLQHDGI